MWYIFYYNFKNKWMNQWVNKNNGKIRGKQKRKTSKAEQQPGCWKAPLGPFAQSTHEEVGGGGGGYSVAHRLGLEWASASWWLLDPNSVFGVIYQGVIRETEVCYRKKFHDTLMSVFLVWPMVSGFHLNGHLHFFLFPLFSGLFCVLCSSYIFISNLTWYCPNWNPCGSGRHPAHRSGLGG